jgi:hypothetical protein
VLLSKEFDASDSDVRRDLVIENIGRVVLPIDTTVATITGAVQYD